MDNDTEYQRPDLYDLENPDFEPDGLLYLELANQVGGPILDLGCGTGRFTIPLAQKEFEVVGIDAAGAMLARAREKAGDIPIQWMEADARSYNLGRQFKLIIEGGGVFMHMLTREDQRAFLDRARSHLAPGGRLVIALWFPHPKALNTDLEEKEWFSYTDNEGRAVKVSGVEEYDELRQVKTETAIRRIAHPDGSEEVIMAPLALRYTFPQEMEGLLDQAGFEVVARYGGPDKSPLANDSRSMVYVCGIG